MEQLIDILEMAVSGVLGFLFGTWRRKAKAK